MITCSYHLHWQISYQVSFCPPPIRVNILRPDRFWLWFSLHTHTETHFALWWMWPKSPAVCKTLNKTCVKALQYILMFDLLLLTIYCEVTIVPSALIDFAALKKRFLKITYSYPFNCHHCHNYANICLCCLSHFLSADFFLLGSPQVKQVSGVVLKVELAPCFFNDWHLCQSIHSGATACNESHLAGRWADLSRVNDQW